MILHFPFLCITKALIPTQGSEVMHSSHLLCCLMASSQVTNRNLLFPSLSNFKAPPFNLQRGMIPQLPRTFVNETKVYSRRYLSLLLLMFPEVQEDLQTRLSITEKDRHPLSGKQSHPHAFHQSEIFTPEIRLSPTAVTTHQDLPNASPAFWGVFTSAKPIQTEELDIDLSGGLRSLPLALFAYPRSSAHYSSRWPALSARRNVTPASRKASRSHHGNVPFPSRAPRDICLPFFSF